MTGCQEIFLDGDFHGPATQREPPRLGHRTPVIDGVPAGGTPGSRWGPAPGAPPAIWGGRAPTPQRCDGRRAAGLPGCRASGIGHRASGIEHRASSIEHRASSIDRQDGSAALEDSGFGDDVRQGAMLEQAPAGTFTPPAPGSHRPTPGTRLFRVRVPRRLPRCPAQPPTVSPWARPGTRVRSSYDRADRRSPLRRRTAHSTPPPVTSAPAPTPTSGRTESEPV